METKNESNEKESVIDNLLKGINTTIGAIHAERFSVSMLFQLKAQLRVLHAHAKLKGSEVYAEKYTGLMEEIEKTDTDKDFWKSLNEDHNLNKNVFYLNLLLGLYELEVGELHVSAESGGVE